MGSRRRLAIVPASDLLGQVAKRQAVTNPENTGLDKKKDETIVVYDFGGGAFDISVLDIGDGIVEVKASNGDTYLGADDLDQRVIAWIVGEFKRDRQ